MTNVGIDSVIAALPLAPDTALAKALRKVAPEVVAIGDCSEPRLIMQAIADGARAGLAV
jgi:hypothetical protein